MVEDSPTKNNGKQTKQIVEEVKIPWTVHFLRGSLGKALLGILVGFVFIVLQIVFMVSLHPISIVGVVFAPVWFIVTYLLLETQAYKLIEVQFQGDEVDINKTSQSTKIEGYSISPEKWRSLEKVGSPYSFAGKAYVCDRFDEEENKVYFPEHPFFNNINAMAMIDIFLKMKKSFPDLIRENTRLKLNMGEKAENRAIDILEEIGVMNLFSQDKSDWESHGSWRVTKRDRYLTKDKDSEGRSMDLRMSSKLDEVAS